jgi:hypothetical protein
MERKATDILLELEEKLEKVLSYVVNMDNNYKIIISRLDSIKNNNLPVANLSVNTSENIKSIEKNTSLNDTFVEVNSIDEKSKHEKVRVSQVVKYPKSKNVKQNNVVLALVKIYDSKGLDAGTVVAENRTDQNGRWKVDLSPGQYHVHITKPASTQKPQIDHYFPISVDGEKSSLDLEPIG